MDGFPSWHIGGRGQFRKETEVREIWQRALPKRRILGYAEWVLRRR